MELVSYEDSGIGLLDSDTI